MPRISESLANRTVYLGLAGFDAGLLALIFAPGSVWPSPIWNRAILGALMVMCVVGPLWLRHHTKGAVFRSYKRWRTLRDLASQPDGDLSPDELRAALSSIRNVSLALTKSTESSRTKVIEVVSDLVGTKPVIGYMFSKNNQEIGILRFKAAGENCVQAELVMSDFSDRSFLISRELLSDLISRPSVARKFVEDAFCYVLSEGNYIPGLSIKAVLNGGLDRGNPRKPFSSQALDGWTRFSTAIDATIADCAMRPGLEGLSWEPAVVYDVIGRARALNISLDGESVGWVFFTMVPPDSLECGFSIFNSNRWVSAAVGCPASAYARRNDGDAKKAVLQFVREAVSRYFFSQSDVMKAVA